jgi:hypothetical protein
LIFFSGKKGDFWFFLADSSRSCPVLILESQERSQPFGDLRLGPIPDDLIIFEPDQASVRPRDER